MKRIILLLCVMALLALPMGALGDDYASPYTEFDGVNLTSELSGEDIEMTLVYQNEDGTNFAEYLVDSLMVVSYERLVPTTGADAALKAVSALLEAQGLEPVDMAIAEDADVTARLGHTAYRITYRIGSGADECSAVDIYIETDQWAYRYHSLTPLSNSAECAARIEECISTLTLEEITGPKTYADDSLDEYPRFYMPLAADQIELNDFEQYSAVEYEQWYSYDGSAVLFSYERYPACEDNVDAVVELTTSMYESVDELSARQDEALTAQFGHPAYRVEYLTGSAESRMQNVDVIALLDDCALCFHVESAAESYDNYQQVIENWIEALYITDPAAGDAAANDANAVQTADSDANAA